MTLLPQRLKGCERRVQAEKAIEIEDRFPGNVDAGPHGVVLRLAVRDDDVESVGRTALEDHHQAPGASGVLGGTEGGAGQEARDRGRADYGESAVAKEDAASWHETAPSS